MNIKVLITSCFLFFSTIIFAQQDIIDSLQFELKNSKEDTNKVNILNKLALEHFKINPTEANVYSEKAFKLANQLNFTIGKSVSCDNLARFNWMIGDYPNALKFLFEKLKICKQIGDEKGIAASHGNIGLIYWDQGDYPRALKNHFISLKISKKLDDKVGIANSYNNIGNIYADQGNYPEAIKNHYSSLKINEKLGNNKAIADSYNNIGTIYADQYNYSEALKNHYASLKINEEIGNKRGIATCYNNIGNTYTNQANYPNALKNYFSSLKIKEELGDKKGIAITYSNIGGVYTDQGNYQEALKNHYASLKIKEEINNKKGIAVSFNHIGSIKTNLKMYPEARSYFNKSLALSQEIGNKDAIKESYGNLSRLDSLQSNWKGAYYNYMNFILYRDSLDNEETKEKTIKANLNYEFEKKEALTKAAQDKKDILTAIELKKQQIIRYSVSGVLAIVILFTFFLYNRFRFIKKQKNIIELKEKEAQLQKQIVEEINEELNQTNEEILTQRDQIEKQKEKVELAHQEIKDSIIYAKRIQNAILPAQSVINELLPNSFVLYKPKDVVAGDFYWLEQVNNTILFAAADCTGHGVPGAMVSVVCHNALNRAVREFGLTEPGLILDKTREIVLEEFSKSEDDVKDGMDIALCAINGTTLQYAGANNPLWLVRKGELIETKANKQPIGKFHKQNPFTTHSLQIEQNDTIYIFSDGYVDQFGGVKGKKLGYPTFREKILRIAKLEMKNQKIELDSLFENWKGNEEQLDDVCVIGVKI